MALSKTTLGCVLALALGFLLPPSLTEAAPAKQRVHPTRTLRLPKQVQQRTTAAVRQELAKAYAEVGLKLEGVRAPKGLASKAKSKERRLLRAAARLLRALERHHGYSYGHSKRTAVYARSIAKAMGLNDKAVAKVTLAARLHDLGKLGLTTNLLNSTTGMTEAKRRQIELHPSLGEALLAPIAGMRPLLHNVKDHHERLDGSGYHGKRGRSVALVSRIIAVADTFDAITSQRSYQQRQTRKQALAIINNLAGDKLDPRVIKGLERALRYDRKAKTALHNAHRPAR